MGQFFVVAMAICISTLVLVACDSPSKDVGSVEVIEAKAEHQERAISNQIETSSEDEVHVDKPVLHWAKPGLAPLFIDDGTDEGRGIGDQMFVQVKDLMPQFYHVNLNLNYPRLLEELRKGSDVCAILHYSDERAKFIVYSKSVIITPSYQLYVSAKGLESFKKKTGWKGGPASFEELLSKSHGLRMAITPGQSYGAERDAILARHIDKVELIRSFADQEALIKMLAANRMDMVLGFPWVINYRLEQLDVRSDLVKVPLNDVAKFESAYIACADTELGRRVVKAVDEISPPIHDRSKSFLTRWLTAKESQEYYGIYHDYFFEDQELP